MLNNGSTTVSGQFISVPGSTDITFFIKVLCAPPCIATSATATLPACSGNRIASDVKPGESNGLVEGIALDIHPNPANTSTTIYYHFQQENSGNDKKTLLITDVTGRPVLLIEVPYVSGTYLLNLSGFTPGIYFVESRQNNRRLLSKRMIVYDY
jgi:hypothetical protein